MEDTENTVVEAVGASQEQPVSEVSTAEAEVGKAEEAKPSAEAEPIEDTKAEVSAEKPEKTFTSDEMNSIVRDRVKRLYGKYGVDTSDELDEMVGKSQAYDVTKEENSALEAENASLKSQIALMKSDIDIARYDDVKAILGVKKLEINDENIKSELATHPEWVKKNGYASVQAGSPKNSYGDGKKKTDKEYAEDLFGMKFI